MTEDTRFRIDLSEIEQIHDLIDLMKLASKGTIKLSITEIKDFRKLLQNYSLHQEKIEDLFDSEIIQCLIDSANEEHEILGDYDYYVESFSFAALGAAVGGLISLFMIILHSEITRNLDNSLYKMRTPGKAFVSGDLALETAIILFTSSVGANVIHSNFEMRSFYHDSFECLDYIPQVIGSAPEYVEGA